MLIAMLKTILFSPAFLPVVCLISVFATVEAYITAGKIQKAAISDITAKYKDAEGNVVQMTIQNGDSEKASEIKQEIETALEAQGYEESGREDKKRFA